MAQPVTRPTDHSSNGFEMSSSFVASTAFFESVGTRLDRMHSVWITLCLDQHLRKVLTVSFLGLLHYYRPLGILQGDEVPWGNMAVLVGFGLIMWTAGAVTFRRRDICTV